MKTRYVCFAPLAILSLVIAAPAHAQQRSLTLSDVHICCGMCSKAIEEAVNKVDHVSVQVDKEKRTAKLQGGDGVTRDDAFNALNAIAAAGFYGKSTHQRFKIKDESEGLSGQVTSLALTGIHNCCGGCDKAIKSAVASVEGTKVPEIGKNSREFTVLGKFDAAALVKAINAAGFYVKVKDQDN